MTEGEAEALFDKAVDALCEVYGKPMAASILDGRARLLTSEINVSLGWSPAVQKAMARFQDRSAVRGMREALEAIVADVWDSTNPNSLKSIQIMARAALSGIEPGEDEQARGQGRSAPSSTVSKDTTK